MFLKLSLFPVLKNKTNKKNNWLDSANYNIYPCFLKKLNISGKISKKIQENQIEFITPNLFYLVDFFIGLEFYEILNSLYITDTLAPNDTRDSLNSAIQKWNDIFKQSVSLIDAVSLKGKSMEKNIFEKVFLGLHFKHHENKIELIADVHGFNDKVIQSIFLPYIFIYYLACSYFLNDFQRIPQKEFADFAFGIIWLGLKGKRTVIKDIWQSILPPRESEYFKGIYYDYFTYVEQLSRATDLHWILKKYIQKIIQANRKNHDQWTFENLLYLGLIPYTSLNPDFLQALKLRIRFQNDSIESLAKKMGVSKKTFLKRLSLLKSSFLIQKRNYANWEPLGLRIFDFIISSSNYSLIKNWKNIISLLPNLYRFTEFRGWETVLQAKIVLPNNKVTTKQIMDWLEEIKWFNNKEKGLNVILGVELPEKRRQFLSAEGLDIVSGLWHLSNPKELDGFVCNTDVIKLSAEKKQITIDLYNKIPDSHIRKKYGVSSSFLSNLKRTLKQEKVLEQRWVFVPEGLIQYLFVFNGDIYVDFINTIASRLPVSFTNLIAVIPPNLTYYDKLHILENPNDAKLKIGVANVFIPLGFQRNIINDAKKLDPDLRLITDPSIVPFSPKMNYLIPTKTGWSKVKLVK